MSSPGRNINTGLKFWFWLLLMSLLMIPLYILMQWLWLSGISGTGGLLMFAIVGVFSFVVVLYIYGWIINNKIRR
jgi:hypothetical protein